MMRTGLVFTLAMGLILSACDTSSPTDVEATLDEAVVEQLAVQALEANEQQGAPLPCYERLLRRTFQAVRADPPAHAEGIALLKRARYQAKKAKEALDAGDAEVARIHTARSQALTLEAIISVLGTEVVDLAVLGVDQGLARIEEALAGKPLPDRFLKALDRVRSLSARAHEALDSGQPRNALASALAAADLLRALSVPFQARRALRWANKALGAALDAVKADPTQDEMEALRKARAYLRTAKDAFDAGKFQKALRLATESGRISLEVLWARSGD